MTNLNQEELDKQANLHTAGAIIRRSTPFENLLSHRNETALSHDFIKQWVIPYYMTIARPDGDWITAIQNIKPQITKDICWQLLGDLNWRNKRVGSYFACVKGYTEMIDTIGVHLLKNEVCCVGHIYSLTLAFFNTPECFHYLDRYLDYYLAKPDLYYDQRHAMNALLFLDKVNGSSNANKHFPAFQHLMHLWKTPEDISGTQYFEEQIPILKSLSVLNEIPG